MKIRVVSTASKARAVQVVRYENNRRIMVKHFGSCHSDEQLRDMLMVAEEWLKDHAGQLSIFTEDNPNALLHLGHCSFIGVHYTFFYELIWVVQQQIGFDGLGHPLLNDLVTMRIFEPTSKLRSIELLESCFGVCRQRKTYYKIAPHWLTLTDEIEQRVADFATKTYGFDFDLVFYDVTTLYFETFEEDELRKNVFSKDNKSQQPQILVALMVTKEGFPMAFEVFPGNTFEGHTIIPAIKAFMRKMAVKNLTVVADAAMISANNIKELIGHSLNYIVGARLGNLSEELIGQVDKILGVSIQIERTALNGTSQDKFLNIKLS